MTDFSKKPTPDSQLQSLQRDFWKLLPVLVVILALIMARLLCLEFFNEWAMVIIPLILVFFVFAAIIAGMKLKSEESPWFYFTQLGPVFIVLLALLASKQIAPDNLGQVLGISLITVIVYLLALQTFTLYYQWFVRHPAEETHESTKKLAENIEKLEEEAKNNINLANESLKKIFHLTGETIVIGSPNDKKNEMMEVLFKQIFANPQTIDITFMGTAYGAFGSDDSRNSSGFGFIDALEIHISNCAKRSNGRDPVFPLGVVNLICCSEDIFVLSAKYLALSIFNALITTFNTKNLNKNKLIIVYPYQDCLAATVLLKGNKETIGLISPSIGKDDKTFISEHYPVGIVIKEIKGYENHEANTLARMKKHLDNFFIDAKPEEIEKWELKNEMLTITNFKKITDMPRNKSEDLLTSLESGLMRGGNIEIPVNSIEDARKGIRSLIDMLE